MVSPSRDRWQSSPPAFIGGMLQNAAMVVKKRGGSGSPSQDAHGDDAVIPLYGATSMPLHRGVSSEDDHDSSSDETWRVEPSISEYSTGLPMWSANPQSPGDDAFSRSGAKDKSLFYAKTRNVPLLIVSFIAVGLTAIFSSRASVYSANQQIAMLEVNRKRMGDEVSKRAKDVRGLKRQLSAMDVLMQNQQRDAGASSSDARLQSRRAYNEMTALQKRLSTQTKQTEDLKKEVQAVSRDHLIEKYGQGPHRVKMELVFPDHKIGPSSFVIELAPIDLMPHSVHTFLEMVSEGLIDGCSFILNALHVVKAAPLPYDGSSASAKAKAFTNAGLESVAFREYNEQYTHEQYTIGFAGDGSPSFYINTEDNTEIHAGDPCFGKVIEGFDTVRRLEASPTRNGIWFDQRIGIKQARLV